MRMVTTPVNIAGHFAAFENVWNFEIVAVFTPNIPGNPAISDTKRE